MKKPKFDTRWKWIVIIVAPCVLLGLMMLVGGIGKLPFFDEVVGTFPGQTEFLDVVFGPLWPTVAFFISNILHWVELVLGVALVMGIYPRISAVLTLPLIAGFMSSNIYAIANGETFDSCGCFGVFEKLFGDTTPLQSLGIDIALLLFALIIIFLHPAPFLSFQSWFAKRKGGKNQ